MGEHRVTLGRRGWAALAAAGALMIGGASAMMVGTGNADVLDALTAGPATTTVLPDLAPFQQTEHVGAGTAEVSDQYGAPAGGGEAALRLSTPDAADHIAEASGEDAGTPLADWTVAAYSAYQGEADNPIQYPSLQLIVDYNGAEDGGFSTLTYEPAYNTGDDTTPEQWHRYLAGAGNWCSTRAIPGVIADDQTHCSNGGAKPLAEYTVGQPDIVVNAVQINQGSGNPGLESAVDLVTTPSTTYDFELTAPDAPGEPGGDHPGGDHPGGGWGPGHGHGDGEGHCGCR